ncbi:hypothetical protein H4Q26_004467 [Puccinia striiformis f. sp. tritici PST-130]|nr:hypothetical protein H4Q26_004467 [Puccinia striiformis f. sp. tritici PST-130]
MSTQTLDIKTQVCVATLGDSEEDEDNGFEDITGEIEQKKIKLKEREVEINQDLENFIRVKDFKRAEGEEGKDEFGSLDLDQTVTGSLQIDQNQSNLKKKTSPSNPHNKNSHLIELKDTLKVLLAYSDRNLNKIDKTVQESFLIEFLLNQFN